MFWKTLLGFLLTYVAASFGVLPTFTLLRHQRSLNDQEIGDRLGPAAVELCRRIIVESGPGACAGRLSGLVEPRYAARLQVTPLRGGEQAGGPAPTASATARGPDGRRYLIAYRVEASGWPLPVPLEVFLLGCIGSLAFSAVLVGYVVAPIRRIRSGLRELARGNLAARVGQKVGRRRDEIADLAQEFDTMAARLEQLVVTRDRLLHDVSHELRSPLSRLQLSIALSRQNPDRFHASLDRIEHEAERLNQMVDELLALSRAESGVQREEDHFDLRELLLTVLSDVEFEAAGKPVAIDLDIADGTTDAYAMQGNAELLRRAIENVLRNAVKFSSVGQAVAVTLRIENGIFILRVRDHGGGIPEALLGQVFDPFVTFDREHAGVGLGLSIARRAVRAHRGEISAENHSEGGLVMTIALPISGRSTRFLTVAGE